MYQDPNYTETVSMRLSEVLADISVDERMIRKRRKTWLLIESIKDINNLLLERNVLTYIFGSHSEGTTTHGMKSDLDQLCCCKDFSAIQNLSDRIPGVNNLLMIQDNSVSPGYCLLQLLRDDAPLPADGESNACLFKDREGKVFFKNSFLSFVKSDDFELHGPAKAYKGPGTVIDNVPALHCTTWPQKARQWLDQQGEGQWPSAEMKRYCSRTGCFVVPVGCSGSEHEQLEWRISTSLAERYLMFDLNITQIRSYVLMKMIIKTFINPFLQDDISSYMCKTVLFHCVANTPLDSWREKNLLNCLSLCLYLLYDNIRNENCPHFIIPGNNLMRRKFSPAVKQYFLKMLKNIINSEGEALLRIKFDDLGSRLIYKFYNFCPSKISNIISGSLLINLAAAICLTPLIIHISLKDSSPHEAVEKLKNHVSKILNFQRQGLNETASLLLPMYYTILGSVQASLNIYQYNIVSADALKLISLGLNTDVASNKLKLCSTLYCAQEIQKADLVLIEIESRYDLQIVEPVCSCHKLEERGPYRQGFNELCDIHNEEGLQFTTAFCVIFLPCEIHCVPNELRYEMFRSTQEDRIVCTEDADWMDCAVVDSLPYLYFLQYKVNRHLGRHDQKQAALCKLIRTIKEEPNLEHRETSLNLLGKCMEQEGRAGDALQYYLMSLNERGRNNAAKIHICVLLSVLINSRT